MTLDLGVASSFDIATKGLGEATNAAAQFALLFGFGPGEWTMEEGSFNGVPFHVLEGISPLAINNPIYNAGLSSINDSGGRRIAKYLFPYTDGQTTDDMGRMPESFDIDVIIHGDNYLYGLQLLYNEFKSSSPGELIHPIRGVITAKVEKFVIAHVHDSRKAVHITATFIEHTYDLGDYGSLALDTSVKSLLNTAIKALLAVQSLINKINAVRNLANSLKNLYRNLVDNWQALGVITASNINAVFNTKGNVDIPVATPINLGGALTVNKNVTTSTTTNITQTNLTLTTNQSLEEMTTILAQANLNLATIKNVFGLSTLVTDPLNKIPIAELSAAVATAVNSSFVQKQVNEFRLASQVLIANLEALKTNTDTLNLDVQTTEGALEFNEDILNIKSTIIALQKAVENGIKQNKLQIIDYTVPRLMSIREIAFENNLSVNNFFDLDILNPELDSLNYIPKGTILKVPV